ncbi:hypothetical protein RF11_06893 [Thelohanellus kitauei]|uniref:Uncharacterized protein n=1 Tax=Thelohanellus kitauei TaxID=669202 RepID=A0A0C2MBD3_THEKT|nr:hypothetical protein RF11_06893 [Thelohanellus kitauei]
MNRDGFNSNRGYEQGYRRGRGRGYGGSYRNYRNTRRMETLGNVHEVPKKVFNVPPPTLYSSRPRSQKPDSTLPELNSTNQNQAESMAVPQDDYAWANTNSTVETGCLDPVDFPTLDSEQSQKYTKKKSSVTTNNMVQISSIPVGSQPESLHTEDVVFRNNHVEREDNTIIVDASCEHTNITSLQEDVERISLQGSRTRRGVYRRINPHIRRDAPAQDSDRHPGSVKILTREKSQVCEKINDSTAETVKPIADASTLPNKRPLIREVVIYDIDVNTGDLHDSQTIQSGLKCEPVQLRSMTQSKSSNSISINQNEKKLFKINPDGTVTVSVTLSTPKIGPSSQTNTYYRNRHENRGGTYSRRQSSRDYRSYSNGRSSKFANFPFRKDGFVNDQGSASTSNHIPSANSPVVKKIPKVVITDVT